MTELCEIMNKYGSDKGSGWHNYTEVYYKFFSKFRNEKLNIFELGLGTNFPDVKSNMGINGSPGASLFGWEEFFPNSDVFGCDIDKRILFDKNRIKTFYCDQTNPTEIFDMWDDSNLKNLKFDIMIDDGLHEFDANIIFFENSFNKLSDDGIYIIEDIHVSYISKFLDYFNQIDKTIFNIEFELLKLENSNNLIDNNLIIIRRNGVSKW
jgi:hypothetical protein